MILVFLWLSLSLAYILVVGLLLVPYLRKKKVSQSISKFVDHQSKAGTPTFGGFIFIVPTLLTMLFLYIRGSLEFSSSLIIVVFVFLAYALLGFVDDFKKYKEKNNKGLSILQKLIIQTLIA